MQTKTCHLNADYFRLNYIVMMVLFCYRIRPISFGSAIFSQAKCLDNLLKCLDNLLKCLDNLMENDFWYIL